MPHRCAFGCTGTDLVMHVFPNPDKFPERFKAWVNLVGGKLETPSDFALYKKMRICDIHFTTEHKNRYKRLNALAIPSLYLPGQSTSQQPEAVNVCQQSNISEIAATSGQSVTHQSEDQLQTIISQAGNSELLVTAITGQSASQQPEAINVCQQGNITEITANSGGRVGIVASVLVEHNYSVKSRPKRKAVYNTQTKLFQRNIRNLRSEICRLRKKGQSFKKRFANAEKLSNDVTFQMVTKNMTKPAQLFAHMQLQTKKKAKGRRFSIQEKILSLSLYKKSPKCYRLLCKYFTLPSPRAMKRLLSQIKLSPGINPIIFKKIKSTLREKEKSERLCSLIFDEMSITPQITYEAHKDELKGFASNQEATFADHALVFMVKGVKNNFKQPIAYYFTNSLTKLDLKKLIISVVEHALEAGLIIVSSICDQSPVNVGAITELINDSKAVYLRKGKEWRYDLIRIKGQDIIPLFDTPHLIKGIRNNLLTKELIYMSNDQQKIIKWDYYQMVYAADKSYGELRLLNKLTKEHVNPDKINKMRVKSATQLFSHSVAVVTEHLTARGDLPEECRQLVDFTLLLDNLFDSLNVSSLTVPNGKIFKGPIKRSSPHHELWQKAKKVLKSVKFIKKQKVGNKIMLVETSVPSVTNLIKTIEGIESLWKMLCSRYSFDAMLTRNFNQDPVENFFGNIRSYGARNIAPNTVGFEGAFKALLINNFSAAHSNKANCEEDKNECLQTLEFFLTEKIETPDVPEDEEIHFNSEICFNPSYENDAGQSNYVCGWILKKCLKNIIKGCRHCRETLLDNSANSNNAFIQAKEYINKKWLCYPSKDVEKYFKEIQNVSTSFLKRDVPKKQLKNKMQLFVELFVDSPALCSMHNDNFKKYFLNITFNIIIHSWCKSINRILDGKISYSGDDVTKLAALNYYTKHKNYKNRK